MKKQNTPEEKLREVTLDPIEHLKTLASYAWDRNWDIDPENMKKFEEGINHYLSLATKEAEREILKDLMLTAESYQLEDLRREVEGLAASKGIIL